MNSPRWRHYLSRLSTLLGREQALSELRWMRQCIPRELDEGLSDQKLDSMVRRRMSGEPLQYILGTQPFGDLNLLTRSPVLIPRPETEDWTIRLAQHIRPSFAKPIKLLDLCTGSGCIPLLLCRLWPPGSVHATAVDISEDAVRLSLDNAKLCGISASEDPSSILSSRNTFSPILANIRDPCLAKHMALKGPFDVITSNPPYIPKAEYETLPKSVKDFEDIRALLGDPDSSRDNHGLTFYHVIAHLIAREGFLSDNGVVAVEVGQGQAADVERILREEGGLGATTVWKDPWDVERVVVASRT